MSLTTGPGELMPALGGAALAVVAKPDVLTPPFAEESPETPLAKVPAPGTGSGVGSWRLLQLFGNARGTADELTPETGGKFPPLGVMPLGLLLGLGAGGVGIVFEFFAGAGAGGFVAAGLL